MKVWLHHIRALSLLLAVMSGATVAQQYPVKPVRLITSGIGGGADTVARILAPGLSANLGQQAIVENRGAGTVTAELFSKMPPDGYSMMLYNNTVWVGPMLQETSYDAVRDFTPVTLLAQSPNIVVVHPAMPVKTMQDLVKLAKSRPGEINYASGATGASNHIAAELFQSMAKVKLTRIAYKSGSQQSADLLGGHVQLMFASASMTPLVKTGKLRLLAVASLQPSSLYPGAPTVQSAGLPGYQSGSYYVIFAHTKAPEAAITRINQESVRYMKTPDAREKFFNAGMEAVGSTAAELAALVKSDIERLGKVIKDANIREGQ